LSQQFNTMSQTLAANAEERACELDAAHRVQSYSLPPERLEIGGLTIAGQCVQRGAVGGDVYDVRLLPGDRVAVLVADLSGHDVSAALNTAMLRSLAWREAEHAGSPGEALARLNDHLCQDLPPEHFASAVFAWFDRSSARLLYTNAGHPASYFKSGCKAWEELVSGGPVLGLIPSAEYPTVGFDLVPDSWLLVCTDGVTEARNLEGDLWGSRELASILESSHLEDPSQLTRRIMDRLMQFRGEQTQDDDTTLVVVGLKASV
jgi:sigma-B regulation protein RsbU (phosphoserine phosphatase)